jgi:predicted DNA-binding protein
MPSGRRKVVKTLAIRLDDEQHTRLGILSKLSSASVTDTIRTAIERHLDALAADPTITAKAHELTDAIEKEAAEQRDAIAALLGSSTTAATTTRGRTAKG